jgi:hypothetical protein
MQREARAGAKVEWVRVMCEEARARETNPPSVCRTPELQDGVHQVFEHWSLDVCRLERRNEAAQPVLGAKEKRPLVRAEDVCEPH